MSRRDTLVHLFAGGCGGTVGAILTCPLEVVKTRLQSSSITLYISSVQLSTVNGATMTRVATPGPLHCLKMILEKEGPRSLFRGLGPNLVGVAPSRAIYFAAYSTSKERMNSILEPDSTQVHMVSAGMAGFTAITATNPIWLIKTRLQLDARNRGEKRMSALQCVQRVYQTDGLRGFYRGMSASYAGISETVIHFVVYESIKRRLLEAKAATRMNQESKTKREAFDFVFMMMAAATSKTCATCIAYPHGEERCVHTHTHTHTHTRGIVLELCNSVSYEVVRTRLREEGTKYRSFLQTVSMVFREEGYKALYRGLTTHLVRQIPNTAIMMATYELVVYLFNR
ncbi:Solute carrier family 25 member 36-A [Bagarius yarrelli]|uniref:Solute carrier family 25 member 36-A n=1 Tax=Bagarius yarrelli TaxID=175774 RepID=A0A556U5U9_BAGYA|nr:Solute carrier family 25 member 36-A [Bagarius yarrelli]